MRRMVLAAAACAAIMFGSLSLGANEARAQWGFGGPSYGWNGGGFRSYYGNGGHDFVPHWHQTQTPFGSYSWYGLGGHDFQPHVHTQTPYSYQGYSFSPWGATQSYYSPSPYYFSPW